MRTQISISKERIPDKSVVYLINSAQEVEDLSFTKTEAAYVKEMINKSEKLIHINSYFKQSFVKLIPEDYNYTEREKTREAGSKICDILNDHKTELVIIDDKTINNNAWADITEGIALSNYSFNKYFKKPEENSLTKIEILSPNSNENEIERLKYELAGVELARDCVNEPHSHLNAENFSKRLAKIYKDSGISIKTLFKEEIEKNKMGGIIAVNKGSETGPTFNIAEWKPDKPLNDKPIVLVGKGVMFDTGGISLKPTKGSMDVMKSDMAGAAAVAGTMLSLAGRKSDYHVIGLMPATDNRPGKDAYLPQDIIHMHDGSTVEVLNTDAEGRIIVADALSYAKKYKPELVIDLATLTGSAEIAVGIKAIAAMGNAEHDMEILKNAGFEKHERIAELPFWDDYKKELKSDIADLKNVGGRTAGAITAGKFLEHFTDYPFIHLDIAGPAYLDSKDSYRGKNATGYGVRLLSEFLYLRK